MSLLFAAPGELARKKPEGQDGAPSSKTEMKDFVLTSSSPTNAPPAFSSTKPTAIPNAGTPGNYLSSSLDTTLGCSYGASTASTSLLSRSLGSSVPSSADQGPLPRQNSNPIAIVYGYGLDAEAKVRSKKQAKTLRTNSNSPNLPQGAQQPAHDVNDPTAVGFIPPHLMGSLESDDGVTLGSSPTCGKKRFGSKI